MSQPAEHEPIRVFLSYSHKDEGLMNELRKHLSILKRQHVITEWHDRQIDAGSEWAKEIDRHLEKAEVVLILISSDFLASDYCYDIEMRRAMERHATGEAVVIPVFLRPCRWKGAPFGDLQGLPTDACPVTSTHWSSHDEAFTIVAQGIEAAVKKVKGKGKNPMSIAPLAQRLLKEASASSGIAGSPAILDSGAMVLLNDAFYESESVHEQADGNVEVQISLTSGDEEAHLRSLRPEGWHSPNVNFAHRNQAFHAQVRTAESRSSGRQTIWTVVLTPIKREHHAFMEVSFNGISADELAQMRARLLLLDEEPSRQVEDRGNLLSHFVGGDANGPQVEPGILRKLWRTGNEPENFLARARLLCVLLLKLTNTCEHIIELRLGPISDGGINVRFRGRRHRAYSNQAPTEILVEGQCQLA